jgi:hypothetical protein
LLYTMNGWRGEARTMHRDCTGNASWPAPVE